MLKMRPSCECCDRELAPESMDALICSFECTFCTSCNDEKFHHTCPNCGGTLVPRPRRATALLTKYPASTERIFKPQGCAQ
jgi:uncharacterized protein